ncbi:uncharacterized protein LOC106461950 [Limulus polyphemus]|uniref:Uncharacterized protein LOC106461950 n=1 Tax=Limulus polyphemus TaxID=6850 RepID=A0ABM1SMA3_LIMPO|nr:uncharacterized protein LOC106461950 [Limulus polyphemus]
MEDTPATLVREELQGQSLVSNLEFHEFIKALKRNGRSIYHMAFGQSPFPAMKHAQLELKKNVSQSDYLTVHGLQEFRQTISRFHEKNDGFTVDPDNIVVAPGSKEVIYHILTAFSGDILLLSPTWTTYEPQARITRHKIHVIPVDLNTGWKLTPEIMTRAVKENCIQSPSLLILCNPDNPTGVAYTEEELKALGECFRREKIIVLSDEIYARLHYTGQHVSLYKFYPEGTIVCTGFSKWASAGGWRVGYAMFPNELSQIKTAITTTASLTYSCAPAPMQYALTNALLQEKECEHYIQLTTKILATISDFCYR